MFALGQRRFEKLDFGQQQRPQLCLPLGLQARLDRGHRERRDGFTARVADSRCDAP